MKNTNFTSSLQKHFQANQNSLTLPIFKNPSIKTLSEFSKVMSADALKKLSKNQQQATDLNDQHNFQNNIIFSEKPHNSDTFSVRSVANKCPPVIGINADIEYRNDICTIILAIISYLLVLLFFPISLLFTFRIVQEYERAVIFCLGRLKRSSRGPGIIFVISCIESVKKVDMRTVSFDVAPQEVLTKDSVTVSVDAVVYYRVFNPAVSISNVEDADASTRLLAQTTLRNVLGQKSLSEILSDREAVSQAIKECLHEATDSWVLI
jgi:hypothetical protein